MNYTAHKQLTLDRSAVHHPNSAHFHRSARWKVSWLFIFIAVACLPFADLMVNTFDPMAEIARLFAGLMHPTLAGIEKPLQALLQTVAFALLGVASGAVVGLMLAQLFHLAVVRVLCALVRAVHELFWALIFLQIFGLHPLTGLLALALPYAATFAKVYAEILEEGERRAFDTIGSNGGAIATFFYARLPDLWQHFISYTSYRFECGLRSSAVLGFVGLPTLGYYLSTAFLEGMYAQVWALLILFYILIASIRYWLRPRLLPVYLLLAPFIIANDSVISLENVKRFFTEDIVPFPLRNGDTSAALWQWFSDLFMHEALPGMINALVLTQLALILTGFVALIGFPFISKLFFDRFGRSIGHLLLVVMRSTPEYILAFFLLTLWGPSMLPAIIALTVHNAGILAHLLGRFTDALPLRPDAATGLARYAYEVVPRIYGQFLAFMFYRWEIMLRETAILGILGIATLGFYIDSAIQDIRLDRAMVLIGITALLNVAVDALSRSIRSRLRLSISPQRQSNCNRWR